MKGKDINDYSYINTTRSITILVVDLQESVISGLSAIKVLNRWNVNSFQMYNKRYGLCISRPLFRHHYIKHDLAILT